jgi:hypothetical protein
MEKAKISMGIVILYLTLVGGLAFAAGLAWSTHAGAAEVPPPPSSSGSPAATAGKKAPRTVYPEKTELDFEGAKIDGEMRNPGEFYFQHRQEPKFDSLVKRRLNFHREMLRDVVLGR